MGAQSEEMNNSGVDEGSDLLFVSTKVEASPKRSLNLTQLSPPSICVRASEGGGPSWDPHASCRRDFAKLEFEQCYY
jgi:hypothetical protein